jgi:hypothetical protein
MELLSLMFSEAPAKQRMRAALLIFFLMLTLIAKGQVLINEVCATNGDVLMDQESGNFTSWVELFNSGSSSTNISGYFLSDDPNLPFKWQMPQNTTIPAKGYLIIWCDGKWNGRHTGFELDADGESLVLSTNLGAQIDRVDFPQQHTNISYGRTTDGASVWKFSVSPSPLGGNNHNIDGNQLDQPIFSKESGRYSGNLIVSLLHPKSGIDIRYTTDGSEPSQASSKYSLPISLSSTRTIKAKAFTSGMLPSETIVATYLINEHPSNLPVVSISTKPAYLWDNTIGIYTNGTNGIPGNCNNNSVNWNQDWDRHATFEYFSASGERQVSQHVDIRIGGACSRNMPQKSFVVNPKGKYGDNDFDYAFFPTKPDVDKFGELFLRNAGNDFNTTMFRDAFFQSLGIGQMDLDYMAYQPTVFYLNGEYWGIQNLREKIDGDYIESNYDIDKEDIDLLETYENAIEGNNSAWLTYKTTLASLNPNNPATFDYIDKNIDVQEYINYLITEIYIANTDWPGNNIKFWRQRSTNGKFRWILWDTDFGFGLYQNQSYPAHPTLTFATATNGPNWPNPPWSTEHIRLVLQNPEFRSRFIATFATAMGTAFHPDRINTIIDEFASRIEQEVPYHKMRWGGSGFDWLYQVQRLRDFSNQRYPFMQSHAADFFGLSPLKFSVNTDPPNSGAVKLNGVTTKSFTNAPYFSGTPYRVEPKPNAGFRFAGWSVTTRESETLTLSPLESSWKYFDQGSLPAANWTSVSFSDASWSQGNAQFGYGEGDEATVVNFGSDANNKYITTYLRKTFNLTDTVGFTTITASALFDDGIVVYLNGLEVYRGNMPTGSIDNSTLAVSAAAEGALISFTISKGILKPGSNTWAVEVHQNAVNSSDLSFEFQASVVRYGNQDSYELTGTHVHDTAHADVSMTAHFIPIQPINGLVLNEVSAAKSFAKDDEGESEDWIELYNAGTQPVDIAGLMLTDDLTRKDKYIVDPEVSWMIQPGQYQILWADGQPEQGKEHLNFKLSADGESIGIYHYAGFNENVIAEFDFDPMREGFSLARIPNATGSFELNSILTPGAFNVEGLQPEPGFWIYPNPTSQFVHVSAQEENSTLAIFDLMGRTVSSYSIDSLQASQLDISHLTDGAYIVKLISSSGEKKSRLVVISR